jgi:hypothetical protein
MLQSHQDHNNQLKSQTQLLQRNHDGIMILLEQLAMIFLVEEMEREIEDDEKKGDFFQETKNTQFQKKVSDHNHTKNRILDSEEIRKILLVQRKKKILMI